MTITVTARHRWPTALVLASAMFLVLFDSLAVATALPAIGAEFGLAPAALHWVITSYSLSIGGLLLLGGRLCDLWNRRNLIAGSLALATAGCVLAALAPNFGLLLTGRVMQGVAAALAIPATLASAAEIFPDEPWRSRVFSVVAAAANGAGLVGAVCGGFITAQLGWRWVFWVVVPIGVVAVAGAVRLLPSTRGGTAGRRLDVAGVVLATCGLVAFLYGISGTAALAVAGLLLLAGLVWWERRAADPLVPPALVASPRMLGGCVAFWLHSAGYAAVVVVGSLQLQDVFGLSPAAAGLVLAPVLLGALATSAPAGALIRRVGSRLVVASSLALCAVTLALLAATGGRNLAVVVTLLVVWGLSAGPIYVGLTRACVGDADPDDRGMASALFESTTHISGAVAVAGYLTLLGAGASYGWIHLLAALGTAAGVFTTLRLMPRQP
ncbi:MFS transporter [Paractinoplanes rishiriensis]|uniref:MFS transporter n=2 Tax=Paractinoplanes rishiriensis TaxID=1050105 RepID=A0A919MUA6_9ACTN|nr:MFS transporter [Actinoplanes rishiriensis]